MSRLQSLLVLSFYCLSVVRGAAPAHAQRIVIFKVDGLNADLLAETLRKTNPATGKSTLPWLTHIFSEHGMVFNNFYSRGISLSAPSWSLLDTGRHTIIRGNVEYDRYTGHVYDYLNVFPFYLQYARKRQVDMPGVEVLDRAGIPLLLDSFPYPAEFQSFQLYQRGVRWTTLRDVLKRRFSSRVLFSALETPYGPSLNDILNQQTETELEAGLERPQVLYLDFFAGDVDHQGHASNDPGALVNVLRELDSLAGRIWTAAQASELAGRTLFVMVSDHGMNNVAGVTSQTYNLPDLFNSREGGAHHVITNRLQLTDFRMLGLNPLLNRVITPSSASYYLQGEEKHYPTAWFDIDGNERASVHLRNNTFNRTHILLLQLARQDLPAEIRRAAAASLVTTIEQHRADWKRRVDEIKQELEAVDASIEEHQEYLSSNSKKFSAEQRAEGEDKVFRRQANELDDLKAEREGYGAYVRHLENILALKPSADHILREKISDLIPELALGDNNTVADLQHYVVGPAESGLVVDGRGKLDEERSFRYVDYFALLAAQRAKNNPQRALPARPIDFTAVALPEDTYDRRNGEVQDAYWLYGDRDHQLLVLTDEKGQLAATPVTDVKQDTEGKVTWSPSRWRDGLPLRLWEDPELRVPAGNERDVWLSGWHTEREWLEATHLCRYSNGLIGITEELSPVAKNVPGRKGISPILLRYEQRRRELVRADMEVFAADHWNFNVRFPNPGGNHGSFLRISTHSVWMMAGAGLPARSIDEPYDSLSFASTLISLLGRTPPMPDRVVPGLEGPFPATSSAHK